MKKKADARAEKELELKVADDKRKQTEAQYKKEKRKKADEMRKQAKFNMEKRNS